MTGDTSHLCLTAEWFRSVSRHQLLIASSELLYHFGGSDSRASLGSRHSQTTAGRRGWAISSCRRRPDGEGGATHQNGPETNVHLHQPSQLPFRFAIYVSTRAMLTLAGDAIAFTPRRNKGENEPHHFVIVNVESSFSFVYKLTRHVLAGNGCAAPAALSVSKGG